MNDIYSNKIIYATLRVKKIDFVFFIFIKEMKKYLNKLKIIIQFLEKHYIIALFNYSCYLLKEQKRKYTGITDIYNTIKKCVEYDKDMKSDKLYLIENLLRKSIFLYRQQEYQKKFFTDFYHIDTDL